MKIQRTTPAFLLLVFLLFLAGCTSKAAQAKPSSVLVDDFLAAVQSLQIEKVKTMLSDNESLVNSEGDGGILPLMAAITAKLEPGASSKKLVMVKYLLSQGADPNKEESSGFLPLESALLVDIEMVKALLEAGADPFKESTRGFAAADTARGLQGPNAAEIQALFEKMKK